MNKEIDPTDETLILSLSSDNSKIATKALEDIFAAGERIIPLLVSCQGRNDFYWGYKLGSPNSADVLYFPDKEGPAMTHVTIEIVALYLLEAIFHRDLAFAQSAFLVDRTINESKQQSFNSDAAIRRAWSSVNQWQVLLNKNGIDILRKKKINPLFWSETSFWGSPYTAGVN